MSLRIVSFQFNGFQENTFVVVSPNKNCVIIDPGCYSSDEEAQLFDFIESNDLKPLALLNTHAHIDHILGNCAVKERYKVPFYIHKDDLNTLHSVKNYAAMYGFQAYKESPEPDFFLENNTRITFEDISFKVFFTPGHAPGHVVFYNEANKFVINGDVLFNGSFGRVDLPGGDIYTLKKSIFETMFQLPEETVVYCGHGPETTIEKEKNTNYIHQF
ncbi:MAG: hypothetical protein CBB76_09830 [Crocinitomicaceae bacterium TMED16]|nr:MAG: hypothetical protein CBB76_09830 [Crocinitomicaceae bacterium TMED16]